jgi:F-type H+-transporting ATPase subunit gamma
VASLRAIRTRIRSVRNTQKITKAMKMVAAAKLRRAQDAVVRARPYAQLIDEMLAQLSPQRAPGTEEGEPPIHPLLAVRPPRRVEVVMMTSDRGLCGGFNSNVIRRGQRFLYEEAAGFDRIQFSTVGRRGRDFARKRGIETRKDYVGFFGRLRYPHAREIANDLIQAYAKDELDAVYLLYNEFRTAISQQISLVQLLPLRPRAQTPQAPGEKGFITPEHLFEPSRPEVLSSLIPRFLAMQIWRALLESEASEHGARMTAMDSATKNASDMIGRLTLDYNRARQAAITKELMEIVSGAEAMK